MYKLWNCFHFWIKNIWSKGYTLSLKKWIYSYLSTPYTQETRRTSNNAKSSRFQEGAWDLNQSRCYHIIRHTNSKSSWNLHLESTGRRIKDVMAGSPTHWRGWTCECLHGKWMASQEPTWTARLPPPPTKSSLSWRFCLRVWCKILTKLSRFLSFSLILCENKFLCLWFVRSQSRPLIAQCSDHCLKCPENAAQQCDIYYVVKIFRFRHNWWEIIYLPKASVISMRKKRADHTFQKNISNIATLYNGKSVMGLFRNSLARYIKHV